MENPVKPSWLVCVQHTSTAAVFLRLCMMSITIHMLFHAISARRSLVIHTVIHVSTAPTGITVSLILFLLIYTLIRSDGENPRFATVASRALFTRCPNCYILGHRNMHNKGTSMRLYKSKAAMRIGFFGGGTDVSPYAEQQGGKVLNCTIDKYVRCMMRPSSDGGITIRSLDLEEVSRKTTGHWQGQLSLPQAVLDALPDAQGVEVTMFSDVPPGSGLGSSSALVVSLLKLLATASYTKPLDPHGLAELAYRIERIDLGIPGGRQDQYAAAFGGMSVYHFGGPQVIVEPVITDQTALLELESCLLIGYIGDRTLLTHHLMEDQVRRLKGGDTLRYHDETKAFVDESVKLLRSLNIADFGRLLHDAWEVKKAFSH